MKNSSWSFGKRNFPQIIYFYCCESVWHKTRNIRRALCQIFHGFFVRLTWKTTKYYNCYFCFSYFYILKHELYVSVFKYVFQFFTRLPKHFKSIFNAIIKTATTHTTLSHFTFNNCVKFISQILKKIKIFLIIICNYETMCY
jgi:hypothetical protein